MTSLDEAYDRRWSDIRSPRRVVAGLVLVGAGVVAVAAAMALVGWQGDSTGAKRTAGITAGIGVPAMLLGIVVVLPASFRVRAGVVSGAGLALTGVGMFARVYPERWTRTADPLAFETLLVYGIGCAIALWFVFTAIATFRLRNNPQGTVHLEIVRQGETRTVEVSQDRYRDIVSDGGDTEKLVRQLDE